MKTHLRLLTGLLLACALKGALSVACAGTFKHIAIDGDFADWAGVPIAYSDPSEPGASAGTDFKDVWIANDDDFIYVRVSLYNTGDLLRAANNVFIDADGDSTTGYGAYGTGSEMLIQGGTGYQEKNGNFNDGTNIVDLAWASAPSGSAGQFEFRISRQAKYADGGDVFTSESIGILLETENNSFQEVDIAQDDGPIPYAIEPGPAAGHGNFQLVSLTGTSWRFNRTGSDLGSDWRELAYDDNQAGWESGNALFGKTPTPGVYPVAIATPFSDNLVTHYFRARFNWTNDPAGQSLVASNYLSDGAIVYLNGAEVARIRMPTNSVTASTPATGANPAPGQVELVDLPPSALVIGDNILAVEVHQSAIDTSDLVFGLSLLASDQLPAAIISPASPQTLTVNEGAPATFTVTVRGAEPITYQWYKGATAIPGATNATYMIAAVAPSDAGQYQVEISNAGAQNVASPTFTLQPQALPVTFKDPNLPADVTVTEGGSANFTVDVAGSQPIEFQWFKDGLAISPATNQTYQIATVFPRDAGVYTCVVSNRVTAPLTSRPAKLTVNTDLTVPALVSAAGGGTHVSLQFSEPLDSASVTAGNFSLSPTVPITAARLSTNDASVVLLDSGSLTNGALYTVSATRVTDRFGNAISTGAQKEFRATILIDGDFTDWADVSMALSDPQDAGPDTGAHADFKDVWVTSDNDYIYLRFTLWQAVDPFDFHNNIFIDADNDPTTGYAFSGIGSDMLIQSGSGYEEKAGLFNNGTVDDLDWLAAPNPPGTDFEMRISRKAKYTNPDAGGLVFKSDTIALVLESENSSFTAVEFAPDSGSPALTLTLAKFPLTDLGSIAIAQQGGNVTIRWTSAAQLQETGSLTPPNWQDVANASSPYSTQVTGQQHFYRLSSP